MLVVLVLFVVGFLWESFFCFFVVLVWFLFVWGFFVCDQHNQYGLILQCLKKIGSTINLFSDLLYFAQVFTPWKTIILVFFTLQFEDLYYRIMGGIRRILSSKI